MLSENVDKIYEFSDYTFDEKEKLLIVATMDYIYWGINVSSEITSDYLLFKQIKNLEDRINKKLDEINRKFDIYRECKKKLQEEKKV